MKFFLALALLAVAASAAVIKPTGVTSEIGQISEIIAAINSPSTDPATAILLEQQLLEAMGLVPEPVVEEPVVPSPVIIDPVVIQPQPVITMPTLPSLPAIIDAIVDALRPPGVETPSPALVEGLVPVVPVAPVLQPTLVDDNVVSEGANYAESSPLVQIIVNVKANSAHPNPVAVQEPATPVMPAPVGVAPSPVLPPVVQPVIPEPVTVVEQPALIPSPVVLPEGILPALPEPIAVVEQPSVPLEPVSVAEPILPVPVNPVVLPETLN